MQGVNMISMRTDAQTTINAAIRDVLPDTAAAKALDGYTFAPGRVRLVAAGKAVWWIGLSSPAPPVPMLMTFPLCWSADKQ